MNGVRVLVLQHHKENQKKCSLTPVRGRADLEVHTPKIGPQGYLPFELEGGILLRVDAPPLSPKDLEILAEHPDRRLVILDANWIKVPALLRVLRPRGPLVERSLPTGIATAYPRRSKLFDDPPAGLASIEAIAAALAVLGVPDLTYLEGYPWAAAFLEKNHSLFCGAAPAAVPVTAAPA